MLGRTGSAGRVGRHGADRAGGPPRALRGMARPGSRPAAAPTAGSSSLRLAVIGPLHPGSGALAMHTVRLSQQLADAGHDVTLVSWSPEPVESLGGRGGPAPFPRTVRSLQRARPDTWVRTGRRLRAYDAVVVIHAGVALVPMGLAVLRAAGVSQGEETDEGLGGPRAVLVCADLDGVAPGSAAGALLGAAVRAVDGVVVHRPEQAETVARLGAARVYAVPEPGRPQPEAGLSADWAAYLGVLETLAAGPVTATDPHEALEPDPVDRETGADDVDDGAPSPRLPGRALRDVARWGRGVDAAARARLAARRRVELGRDDLADWVLPTDVLDDAWRAEEARDESRRLGLPRTRDAVAAWAALGALAAVLRVADDGRLMAVVADESGPASPLTRWLRACGFSPVDLGLTTEEVGYDLLEVDAASLDVVARVHPGGCDADDVDHTVAQAAWALRPGGLLVLTLPLGRRTAARAGRPAPAGDTPSTPHPALAAEDVLGPADVRALVARAHDHGFVLVGDLDGEVGRSMRAAARAAEATPPRSVGAAYGLVRLTLRRR